MWEEWALLINISRKGLTPHVDALTRKEDTVSTLRSYNTSNKNIYLLEHSGLTAVLRQTQRIDWGVATNTAD